MVSLPVAISAIVRWSMISPTDQSFSLGFQSAWSLGQSLGLPEDLGPDGLKLTPKLLDRLGKCHVEAP